MKYVSGITQKDIIEQWDIIAEHRASQIQEGKDLSFDFVLIPSVLSLSAQSDFSSVVDIGCGPGVLTRQLSSKAERIVGIDMSFEMIKLARKNNKNTTNVQFINSTVEEYATHIETPSVTLAVANMTLMTALDLDGFLKSVSNFLVQNGHFIFTITHPCFWPLYHGYANEEWFDYKKEYLIEDVFRISLDSPQGGPKTIHVHRPIEQYVLSILKSGFVIDYVSEPMPTKEVEKRYPRPWKYPRFLCIRCIKMR